jgi:hypothetical protein
VRRPAVLLGLLLAATALTGCGSGPADGPRAAARAFGRAWTTQDGSTVCRLLAPETRAEVAQSAKQPCPQAVLDEDVPGAGELERTRVWGQQAQVRTTRDTLFLAEFTAGWRVVAAGCRRHPGKPYDCQLQGG